MAYKHYTVTSTFEPLTFIADLTQASAPIYYVGVDDEEFITPYQTADARHDVHAAAMLVIRHLGAEWYAAPNEDADAVLEQIENELEVA